MLRLLSSEDSDFEMLTLPQMACHVYWYQSSKFPSHVEISLTGVPCVVLVGRRAEMASCIPLYHNERVVKYCDWLHAVCNLSISSPKAMCKSVVGILAMFYTGKDLVLS